MELIRHCGKCKALSWLGTLLLLSCGAFAAELGTNQQNHAAPPSEGLPRTVTLITGDQVVLTSEDGRFISVQPGKGRERMSFTTQYQFSAHDKSEHLYVIPHDAAPLIAAGKLDRGLFDLTALLQFGYDDDARDDLPLIITYEQDSLQRMSAPNLPVVGATVAAQLESVNGVAIRAQKQNVERLWDSLAVDSSAGARTRSAAALPGLSSSVKKVWLDRLLKPVLDNSVPQIGAPSVWAAGYTGRSVVVAVIDTGVDASHPDLAGRVIDSRNFTAEVDDDIVGHGTHVASTIAGSGAASNGRYRGVAPDAQVVSAKVCEAFGCSVSAIIEGMQWAVAEKHAKVVNMSLGGPDSPEIDPQEEAVNRLTADYGALFVVAAGNCLPGEVCGNPQMVSSPASADAAFAVGAVDRLDQIAFFSNRGPRTGDNAVKPDITAPGVRITAARARNTELGQPIDEWYVGLSGTSMATPHVAGAAALLSERHPDWTPAQLKAGLMGSSRFNPALSVFDQGAGRLDVAAAFQANAIASASTLNLGTSLWPHGDDEPVVRTITYRSLDTRALMLSLRVEVIGPGGKTAPAGMLSVTPAVLSIPAGGTGTATLTVNTRLPATDGIYSGRLVAAADGRTLSTPLAFEREEESYDLVLKHVDRQGTPASMYSTVLVPLDQAIPFPFVGYIAQDVRLRVRRGRYAVNSTFLSFKQTNELELTELIKPIHDVSAPGSLTLDARTARRITLQSPTPTAQNGLIHLGWEHKVKWGEYQVQNFAYGSPNPIFYTAHLGAPAKGFSSFVSGQWLGTGKKDGSADHPELYAASWRQQEIFPTGLQKTVRPQSMAVVEATYLPALPRITQGEVGAAAELGQVFRVGLLHPVSLPYRRTEYYSTAENGGWVTSLRRGSGSTQVGYLLSGSTHYPAARHYRSHWNEPPFGPFFISDWHPNYRGPYRTGDRMALNIQLFGDRANHMGEVLADTRHLVLYRNGQKLAEADDRTAGDFAVSPEAAAYRLEVTATQQVLGLSTRVSTAWDFESAHVSGDAPVALPLLTVQFKPILSPQGQAIAGSRMLMPISLRQNGQTGAARVGDLTVEVSFDDGSTWSKVPVKFAGAAAVALIKHPPRSGYVSLRGVARDLSGNRVEETLIRAYALRDRSPSHP